MKVLTDEVIASFKDAARKLTGPKRRAFQAQVTLDYLEGIDVIRNKGYNSRMMTYATLQSDCPRSL